MTSSTPPELPSILIVEESTDDLLLIQRALRKCHLPHPIVTVHTGEEAINYLSGSGPYRDRAMYPLPGVMLIEVRLPRRSGIDVIGWLRQQPALRAMPVIALTGVAGNADAARACAAGADHCLGKPISADDLMKVFRRVNLHWLHFPDHPPAADIPQSPLDRFGAN